MIDNKSQSDEGLLMWVAIIGLLIVIGFAFFMDFFKAFIKGLGQWIFK
jgi:purine-cytosine permease-like protein